MSDVVVSAGQTYSNETITTTVTTGITLSSAADNPLTITSTGGVSVSSSSIAIYVDGNYKVSNSGAVIGEFGIAFAGGGFVSNTSTGVITADGGLGATGIAMKGVGTVHNAGTISSTHYGVVLRGGGYVSNASGGIIEGGGASINAGVYIGGSTGTLVNYGTISGNYGVILNSTTANIGNGGRIEGKYGLKIANGTVYNKAAGTIMATGGVAVIDDAGGVANFGLIESTGGTGVVLGNNGTLLNAAGATISGTGTAGVVLGNDGTLFNAAGATISGTGNYGVLVKGGGTIIDAGTITNSHDVAIVFSGGGNDRLILDPTADLHGAVGGGTGSNVLELAAGTALGYIQSLHTFYGFNNITLDAGSTWGIGGSITNTDTLTMDSKLSTPIFLVLGAPNEDSGTISGFQSGDEIGLYGEFATGETFKNGFLTLTGEGANETFAFAGNFTTQDFTLTASDTGTLLTTDIPCFCAGTRILTTFGEKLVEDICVGDELVTCLPGGPASRKVIWTGQRKITIAKHAAPALIRPIRIRAGAVAPGVPERDLRLSPHHAVYLDGCLFEAQALINNDTIYQEQNTETVTYHHIELDAHSIILANGMPTETFLDTGNRYMFDNNGALTLHPDFRPKGDADFCAPLIREGALLTAVKEKLTQKRKKLTAA